MTCDFDVIFNSISVISGQCLDDNERLCAMELFTLSVTDANRKAGRLFTFVNPFLPGNS